MAFYRERDLREFAKEVTNHGVGIGGGFIVGGLVGSLVESKLAPYDPFDPTKTLFQKLWGWASNNGAKAVMYMLAKKYDAAHPMAREATKALAGSVVFDTVVRLANDGNQNPNPITIGGYRILGAGANTNNVQKLVQENSLLRTELNKALQKLAGPRMYPPSQTFPGDGIHPPGVHPNQGLSTEALPYPGSIVQHPPPGTPTTSAREWQDYRGYIRNVPHRNDSAADFRYAGAGPVSTGTTPPTIQSAPAFQSPAVEERQRRYGTMPAALPWTPDVMERQRRYGSMPYEQSPDLVRREHRYGFSGLPYGAMPFEQHTEKTIRQRYFGQMVDPNSTPVFEMYGMR